MVSCRQLSRPAPFSMIRSAWVMVSMSAGEALVVVGVQVGLEQAGHLDPVAADVGGEAGHLGGGGHHPQGLTAGLLRRAGRPVGGCQPAARTAAPRTTATVLRASWRWCR